MGLSAPGAAWCWRLLHCIWVPTSVDGKAVCDTTKQGGCMNGPGALYCVWFCVRTIVAFQAGVSLNQCEFEQSTPTL